MSSLLEPEKSGVTIISTIQDFCSETECRSFYYCVTQFDFHSSGGSKWILDYNLPLNNSECFYAYLSRVKDDDNDLIDLSGTISVVTHDGIFRVLAMFLNYEFDKNEVKEIKLQNVYSFPYEKEELFPKGDLILRCHLWKSPARASDSIEYRVRYRYQKHQCTFPWALKVNVDEDNKIYFDDHKIEIPMDFAQKNNLRINCSLKFEKSANPVLKLWKSETSDFKVFLKPVILAQCADETSVCLSKCKYYSPILSNVFVERKCEIPNEFKNNTGFYYPNGVLNLICHLKCIKILRIEYESIHQNCNTPLEVENESDESDPGTIVIPLEEDRTLKHSMYSLYVENKFCDVTLCCGNKSFSCHKAVLCARSVVFSTMFQNDMLEKKNGVVNIEDVEPHILSIFLKYMYTDKVSKIEFEDTLFLFAVAEKYLVMPLRKKCIFILKSQITTRNAVEALICADMHQNDDLKNFVINFICEHAKNIICLENWKSFKMRYPELALEVQDNLIKNFFI